MVGNIPIEPIDRVHIGIDPGVSKSALVELFPNNADHPIGTKLLLPPDELIAAIEDMVGGWSGNARLTIEKPQAYAGPARPLVLDTMLMAGRIVQIAADNDIYWSLVTPKEIGVRLCEKANARLSEKRQQLIMLWGKPGTKKEPGGTYGVVKDMWSALAVATKDWLDDGESTVGTTPPYR